MKLSERGREEEMLKIEKANVWRERERERAGKMYRT